MDISVKDRFIELWERFVGASLPIVFFYTDDESYAQFKPKQVTHCLIAYFGSVLKGETVCLDAETIGALGADATSVFRKSCVLTLNTSSRTEYPAKLKASDTRRARNSSENL